MSAIVLPPQSYIRQSPDYAWNGFCSECEDTIFGPAFVCKHGETCIDCAVAKNFLCNVCLNETEQCSCPQVVRFYVPVNIREAA